jgi:hypothetical protein
MVFKPLKNPVPQQDFAKKQQPYRALFLNVTHACIITGANRPGFTPFLKKFLPAAKGLFKVRACLWLSSFSATLFKAVF